MSITSKAMISVVVLLTTVPGLADAQTVWTRKPAGTSVELELLRPNFAREADVFDGASGAGFLTFRTPIATRMALVADLPFTRAGFDVEGVKTANEIGNPYVGVEWSRSDRFMAELGVRVPVGDPIDESDDLLRDLSVMGVGLAGELERAEAFVPATVGVYAIANYTAPLNDGLEMRVRGGPSFLGGDGASEDLHMTYTGQLWYGTGAWHVGGGLAGRWVVTGDDGWSDDTVHQVVLGGDYGIGKLRPGLQVRIPLDSEVSDVAGSTIGMSLGYRFR